MQDISVADNQKIQQIKDSFDLANAANFGAPAQKRIADFSDSVLAKIRSKDSGEVGNLLNDLVAKVKGYNPTEKNSLVSKIPFLRDIVNSGENLLSGYEKLSTQVDKITRALDAAKIKLLEDVQLYDDLYNTNLQYFQDLELYITAGEQKLSELQLQAETLKKSAADPMQVQQAADFQDLVTRFEKKLHDLKLSKTIAIQTAPQIRLIQNNDKVLIDRVQSALFHTIPLWKNQLVIALGLSNQQQVLKLQRAVSDATNDLLKRNAELLKQNTLDTARENERGIVDIDTVKKVNADLIATIEETVKIQQEGRVKRAAAEKELLEIESQLKAALLRNSNHFHNE